jgi:hypothetical protein
MSDDLISPEDIDAESIIEELEEDMDDDAQPVVWGSSRSGQSHPHAGGVPRGSGSRRAAQRARTGAGAAHDEDDDDDERDTMLGTEGGYGLSGQSKEHVNCLHCGAKYTYEGEYHGYYCEDCRPPNGFRC